MRILLVAATALEVAPLASALSLPPEGAILRSGRHRGHHLDVLVTGVGMVATAVWSAKTLADHHYDLALNLGVCGSFDAALSPGAVVHITADCLSELGAEDGEEFLTIHQMQLLAESEFPYTNGQLLNAAPPANVSLQALPEVRGVTVNTVHGAEASIAQVKHRFAPQVESMEGAAFMYACLIANVPFAQVRAVSNVVERRNRAAWKMPDAINALTRIGRAILDAA